MAGAIINGSEVVVLVAAVVILLSMLGLNLSGLLIPAGVAMALAAKDLSHNFLAGFFLFAVQARCSACWQRLLPGLHVNPPASRRQLAS